MVTNSISHDPSPYLSFAVTVDVAPFSRTDRGLDIGLIERGNEPHKGKLALPGGFVEVDEDLPEAAARELLEETGLEVTPDSLRQLGAYGQPDRDPRMRVVTVVYWVMVDSLDGLRADSDAADVVVLPVDRVLDHAEMLAFDHHEIIRDAVEVIEATGA